MPDRALILSADHYSIPDEKTGVIQELYQMWYVNDYREDSATELGCKPIKTMTTPEMFESLRKQPLPALFDLDLRSRPGKGGAAALTIVGLTHVSTPPLFNDPTPARKAA